MAVAVENVSRASPLRMPSAEDSRLKLPPADGARRTLRGEEARRLASLANDSPGKANWGDVRRTRVGARVMPTGLEPFDVECWVLATCVERIESKLRAKSDNEMDKQRRNQMRAQLLRGAMGIGNNMDSEALRTAESASDPVLSELAIVRSSVARMQEEVRELCGRFVPVARVRELEAEVDHLRQQLANAAAAPRPSGNRSPRSIRAGFAKTGAFPSGSPPPGIIEPVRLNDSVVPPVPVDETPPLKELGPVARRFRELYPDCFWSHVVLLFQYGVGDYDLLANIADPEGSLAFPPRIRLRKEASMYGLSKMAEALCQHRASAVLIRRLYLREKDDEAWKPELQRTPLYLGGNEASSSRLEKKLHLLPPPLSRCKGIISYLGTKSTRASENLWVEANFENPCQGSVEVMVACSSVWGKSDPSHIVDERMEFFSTQDRPSQWVAVDFIDAVVIPQAYSFVSFHPIMAGYFPRTWKFQGSMDGRHWETLTEHENDQTLTKQNPVGVWMVHADHATRKPVPAEGKGQAQRVRPRTSSDIIQERVRALESEGLDIAQLRLKLAEAEHNLTKQLASPEGGKKGSDVGSSLGHSVSLGPFVQSQLHVDVPARPATPAAEKEEFMVKSGRSGGQGLHIPSPRRLQVPTMEDGGPPDAFAPTSRRYYRYFRVLQTGPNSFGSHELQITSLEVYGEIANVTKFTPKPAPPVLPERDVELVTGWPEQWDQWKSSEHKAGGGKKGDKKTKR